MPAPEPREQNPEAPESDILQRIFSWTDTLTSHMVQLSIEIEADEAGNEFVAETSTRAVFGDLLTAITQQIMVHQRQLDEEMEFSLDQVDGRRLGLVAATNLASTSQILTFELLVSRETIIGIAIYNAMEFYELDRDPDPIRRRQIDIAICNKLVQILDMSRAKAVEVDSHRQQLLGLVDLVVNDLTLSSFREQVITYMQERPHEVGVVASPGPGVRNVAATCSQAVRDRKDELHLELTRLFDIYQNDY